jgi:hypothetical protein
MKTTALKINRRVWEAMDLQSTDDEGLLYTERNTEGCNDWQCKQVRPKAVL